jgi:predicted deacetylase
VINLKEKDIKRIMDNIGDYNPSAKDMIIIGNLANKYQDKSDEDIFVEIIRVKDEMGDSMSEEQYQSILEKLDGIRPMLSEEQNEKLDRVLELLEGDK